MWRRWGQLETGACRASWVLPMLLRQTFGLWNPEPCRCEMKKQKAHKQEDSCGLMLPCAFLASLALAPAQQLAAVARAGPLFVSDASRLQSLAEAVEASTEGQPCDVAAINGRWRLLATTNVAEGGPVLPLLDEQPALGIIEVSQEFLTASGVLRCDNVITIIRPEFGWDFGLLSLWTALAPGGRSALTLQHTARVIENASPLRVDIKLDRIMLDANRGAGERPEKIGALAVPSFFPDISEGGTFDITYVDDDVRIARAVSGDVLRIYERE